ncbi:PAS domain-containing protein [Sphingobium algorifonticola]|uniref:histidine kinase n=1 Tax=Sphingobium algorifonticola TaxID=2008318 RepID=A0A437JDP2_9SPHN|nr:PAS domain-containing protein [Sphingobium algorifonticola]RVT44026.1 PAS domain S-box protein [Sphingobium algorifonticola]
MSPEGGVQTDRAALLAHYDLDAAGFEALDDITRFASRLCAVPTAIVSIVEDDRQRFLARVGLEASETPRHLSFCAHAMLGEQLFTVPDTHEDPRFAENGLVTGPPFIRFYAGAPLKSSDGIPLGALCVIDSQPREGLTAIQEEGLILLAQQVSTFLENRRADRIQRKDAKSRARALAESEERFRILADAMPQMVWSTLPDGYHDYYNARWYAFTGMPEGSTDGEEWNGMFHPDDQPIAWERWRHSLATGDPYEIEYRLRHHSGDYRWVLGRALPMRDAKGRITRWFGTCTDIHARKQEMEEREMIAHELSHRIKNIFSVINGLIGLSARQHPALAGIAEELRDRVNALGRAHDYVRPHSLGSASEQGQNSLIGVLGQLFAPYQSAAQNRIIIHGADQVIDDRSATPLALLFHELATNAAKYGALSNAQGKVHVTIAAEGETSVMEWREEGGPSVASPSTGGFGTRLIALSVERQLGGRIERDWRPEGLVVSLRIPTRAMRRDPAETG